MAASQDIKVAAALKDLPQRLQTPSLVVRRQIFQDLEALLSSNDLPENIIKGLCKVVTITLLRYNDAKSRKLVLDFIKSCFSQHPVAVRKSLHAALLDVRSEISRLFQTFTISVCWIPGEDLPHQVPV